MSSIATYPRRGEERAEATFGKVYAWTEDLDMSQAARVVQLYLCLKRNRRSGLAWPGIPAIVQWGHMKRNTAIAAVRELEEAGVILVTRSKGRKSYYSLCEYPPISDDFTLKPVSPGILPTSIPRDTTPVSPGILPPVSPGIPEPDGSYQSEIPTLHPHEYEPERYGLCRVCGSNRRGGAHT